MTVLQPYVIVHRRKAIYLGYPNKNQGQQNIRDFPMLFPEMAHAVQCMESATAVGNAFVADDWRIVQVKVEIPGELEAT